jgi:hypothetical protein
MDARKFLCQKTCPTSNSSAGKEGIFKTVSDTGYEPKGRFIGKNYYSAIRDFSQDPRPDWGAGSPGGGSVASVSGFMADAGTYEYDGSTFVVHHQVAMIPNLMHGGSMTFGCQMEGNDTLILTPQYDKMVIPGMQMKPSPEGKMAYGDMAVRYKFKRWE